VPLNIYEKLSIFTGKSVVQPRLGKVDLVSMIGTSLDKVSE
jgi:hypothetical protein